MERRAGHAERLPSQGRCSVRTAAAHAVRSANARATFARLAEISKTVRTTAAQAAALGVPESSLKSLRQNARRAGFAITPVRQVFDRSAKLAALDQEMSGEGCPRCHLHGAHDVCVTAREAGGFETPSFHDHLFGSGRKHAVFVE